MITPTAYVMRGMGEMVKHVLENANPDFPKNVQPGDIIVAGRNFGCSSGRAIAPKAIKATGVGAVIAEFFSRTFYRNGPEIGLPVLEAPGHSRPRRNRPPPPRGHRARRMSRI